MRRRPQEPIWVDRLVVDAAHLDTIRTHGGLPGLRDENALESALARPRNRWVYGWTRDLATLAAGRMSENALAKWIRAHIVPVQSR